MQPTFVVFVLTMAAVAHASSPVAKTDANGLRAAVVMEQPAPSGNARFTPLAQGGDSSLWNALGPFGGDIADVAVSPVQPNVVLAGLAPSSGGGGTLFRSTDAGDTWVAVADLDGISVLDIEFAPDGTVYVGSADSIWRSLDDGVSWTQFNLSIGINDTVYEVALDPNNTQVLWIGIADHLGSQPVNVMRSTNGGASWADVTPPIGAPISCRGIGIDFDNSNNVAACFGGAFGGGRVWVSTNGGVSWVNRSAGLPNRPMSDIVFGGGNLLVAGGLAFGSQDVGLYSSDNLGANWTPLHDGSWPNLIINDIEFKPDDPEVIYVASGGDGVFRSIDGGGTWSFSVGGTSSITTNSVRFTPGDTDRLFLGASSVAVLRSTDSGANFEQASVGIGALNVESVASNPFDPDELAIAFSGLNDGGVFTSLDGGREWALASLPGTRFNFVSFAPDGTLYAISDGPSSLAPEGLYRRDAKGDWEGIGPDQGSLFESQLGTIEFSLNDTDLIFAGGSDFGVAGFEPTIWRTADNGESWTKVFEGPIDNDDITDIAFVQDGSDLILLATFTSFGEVQNGGVRRSTDGGMNWSLSNTGLPFGAQGEELVALPSEVNTFFLADSDLGAGGVYQTTDAGMTWANTGFVDRVNGIVIDPADEDVLYISQPNVTTRAQMSTDGGQTFTPFNNGLDEAGFVRGIGSAGGSCPSVLLATTTGAYAVSIAMVDGDADGDSDVDLLDYEGFNDCLGQSAVAPCCVFDFNADGSITWSDFAEFQIIFTGAG